jgi:hypothetical protein
VHDCEPTITAVTPETIDNCLNVTTSLTITGTNFIDGGVIEISKGDIILPFQVSNYTSTSITGDVNGYHLKKGKWKTTIINPNGDDAHFSGPEIIGNCGSGNLRVFSFTPTTVDNCYQGPTHISITGTGFANGASVYASRGSRFRREGVNIHWIDAEHIEADIDFFKAKPGDWSISVENPPTYGIDERGDRDGEKGFTVGGTCWSEDDDDKIKRKLNAKWNTGGTIKLPARWSNKKGEDE